MFSNQHIKKTLLPFLKALPFIASCTAICIFLGAKYVLYTESTFETSAKIKLDDINTGASSANLFKNFDVFSNTNKIAAEVEVLKSRVLIEQVLDSLDFQVSYYRVGRIKKTEMYEQSPFQVQYKNAAFTGKMVYLKILDTLGFEISLSEDFENIERGRFKEWVEFEGTELKIELNKEVIASKKSFHLIDTYGFVIEDQHSYIEQKVIPYLDVYPTKDDVAVINLTYTGTNAKKAAKFLNKLTKVYVEDYVRHKIHTAEKTVEFIDNQLDQIGKELTKSEAKLEGYRLDERIINTRQETETDLRKIAQQKIQLANLKMNLSAIDSLHAYMQTAKNPLDLAPNFEAFNDLLSTEIIKKIKALKAEKKDLLIKYTDQNEKVTVIDDKLKDLTDYLKESIQNTRKNLQTKYNNIEQSITEAQRIFDYLPTKERNMIILERDFRLNEKIFSFLTEKRTEASIAAAANISFHRILKDAKPAKNPSSPKKLITIVLCAFIGFVGSSLLVFLYNHLSSAPADLQDLEKNTNLPILGVVKKQHKTNNQDFDVLAAELIQSKLINSNCSVAISSALKAEGRSYIAQGLARSLGNLGFKTLLVRTNIEKQISQKGLASYLEQEISCLTLIEQAIKHDHYTEIKAGSTNTSAIALFFAQNTPKKLKTLQTHYDIVIYDLPAITIAKESTFFMQHAHINLYTIVSKKTSKEFIELAEELQAKYELKNMHMILNKVHSASNYSGKFTGSGFNYSNKPLGICKKALKYFKTYVSS